MKLLAILAASITAAHADLDACVLELVQEFVHSGGKAVLEPPCARQAPHFVTRAAELKPVARP